MKIISNNYAYQQKQQNFGMANFDEKSLNNLKDAIGEKLAKAAEAAIEPIKHKGSDFIVSYVGPNIKRRWHEFVGVNDVSGGKIGKVEISWSDPLFEPTITKAVQDISEGKQIFVK